MNKKTLLTLLQIALTVGLLAFLFRDAEKNRQMLAALSEARLGWIAAAIGIFAVIQICAVTRWQILLRVQGIHIGWWRLSALIMIGVLFNPFIPGNTGGDVAKIFYLLKETHDKKPAALLAVLMDRMIGLFGMILIAGAVIAVRYGWLTQTPISATLLYTLLAIFGGSVAFILVSFAVTGLGLVHKLPARMPLRDKLVDLSVAYNQYGRAWKSSLMALLLCLPVHLCAFTLFYFAGRAFPGAAERASLLDFWAIMPIVNTITSVPLSIGGAGLREGLMAKLLGPLCGVPEPTALMVSLVGGTLVPIFWSLIGGVVYLFYRPSEHARLGEMKSEVSELEHEIAEETK